MSVHKTILKNGLKILVQPMADVQTVSIYFFAGAGGRYEDLDKEYGAAHFLEHLLFKGTGRRPSPKMISEEIDRVGGITNAYTSLDHTAFYVKLPAAHFDLAADILTDILTDPLFDPKEMERERQVILEEIKVYKDDPARHVNDLVGDLLWPDSPMRSNVLGTEQSIGSISRETLLDYFGRLYHMDNMVVSVVGNIDPDEVVDSLKGLVAAQSSQATQKTHLPAPAKLSDNISNTLKKDTNQTHLIITGRMPALDDEMEYPMRLLATALGVGFSSRLNMSIREERGLAYEVYMGLSSFVDTGSFEVYAGVNSAKVDQVLKAIKQELSKIAMEPMSAEELNKAKEQMKGRLVMSMENNASVADMIGWEMIVTGHLWSLNSELGKIEAVGAEQVLQVAKQYLASDKLRLAMIGPQGQAEVRQFEAIIQE